MPAPAPHTESHSGEFQNAHDRRGCSEEAPRFTCRKMRDVVRRDQDVMMVDAKHQRTQHRDYQEDEAEALIRRDYKDRSQDRSRDNDQISENGLPSVQIDTQFTMSRS